MVHEEPKNLSSQYPNRETMVAPNIGPISVPTPPIIVIAKASIVVLILRIDGVTLRLYRASKAPARAAKTPAEMNEISLNQKVL